MKKVISSYEVLKSGSDEQRFSLGVAYPANEVDCHGDFCTPDELEQTAWQYPERGAQVGLMHKTGTVGSGRVVESYIYRFAPTEINGQVIEPGDWLLGVLWDDNSWGEIKKGNITGYSIHGIAYRKSGQSRPSRGSERAQKITAIKSRRAVAAQELLAEYEQAGQAAPAVLKELAGV